MRVSFDLDGVLCDFAGVAVNKIRSMYCPNLPLDYVQRTWNFNDIIDQDNNANGESLGKQWNNVFAELMRENNFWADLPAFEENVEALADLQYELGAENIYMITSRPPCAGGSVESMTKLWLWEHDLPMENLFVVGRSTEKEKIIRDYGIKWSVDDYWPTIEQCCRIDGHNPRLLDREYNQMAVTLPRVGSVQEFLIEVQLGAD